MKVGGACCRGTGTLPSPNQRRRDGRFLPGDFRPVLQTFPNGVQPGGIYEVRDSTLIGAGLFRQRAISTFSRGTSGGDRTGRKHWGQTAPSARRRGTRCFLERSCSPWDGVVSPRVFADLLNLEVSPP